MEVANILTYYDTVTAVKSFIVHTQNNKQCCHHMHKLGSVVMLELPA